MSKTIKETIREYDKDGKLIKEVVKETTESGGYYEGTITTYPRPMITNIKPDWTYRPELQPYCTCVDNGVAYCNSDSSATNIKG